MAKKKEAATPEQRLQKALVPCTEWPHKLPENWCWVKLQYICNYIKAGGDKPKELSPTKDEFYNIPVIANGIENDGIIGYSIQAKEDSGTITVSGRGTIGVAICRDYAYVPVVRLIVISPSNVVYSSYLKYVFDFLEEKGTGSSIPQLTVPMVKGKSVPLAPLPEQQRIVERIESLFAQLDEAKEKAQAALDSFEPRKATILHKAFIGELTAKWREEHGVSMEKSWESACIGNIADVKGGKRVPKGMELTLENTGHPYIKAGNLKHGTVTDENIMYVPVDVLPYIKNYTVKAGDVYITNVGACIGDCGIIPIQYDNANLTENAVKITNFSCSGAFLAQYLSSGIVQDIIKSSIASATLGKLSIANIKKIPVNLPSMAEQEEIVRILDSLLAKEQQAKEAVEAVLEQIDLTKKAILSRAFRGQLGTNDPSEESSVELLKEILAKPAPKKAAPRKRVTIPKEISQLLENPLEKKIIRAFYDQDTQVLDVQQVFQLSSKPIDILNVLHSLSDKHIIEKNENKIFLKKLR